MGFTVVSGARVRTTAPCYVLSVMGTERRKCYFYLFSYVEKPPFFFCKGFVFIHLNTITNLFPACLSSHLSREKKGRKEGGREESMEGERIGVGCPWHLGAMYFEVTFG